MFPVRGALTTLAGGFRYVIALMDRHRTLKGCASAVASELEANAENADLFNERNFSMQQVQTLIDLSAWHEHRVTLHPLARKDAHLWMALDDAYAALAETKGRGVAPPAGEELRELAVRLRETAGA